MQAGRRPAVWPALTTRPNLKVRRGIAGTPEIKAGASKAKATQGLRDHAVKGNPTVKKFRGAGPRYCTEKAPVEGPAGARAPLQAVAVRLPCETSLRQNRSSRRRRPSRPTTRSWPRPVPPYTITSGYLGLFVVGGLDSLLENVFVGDRTPLTEEKDVLH